MKMYFLLNMGIFQPAMLVYQRVTKQGTTSTEDIYWEPVLES